MTRQKFSYSEYARPLFTSRVAMGWADPKAPMPLLMGDEALAIEQVSAQRAREFGAGRAAAREAMEALGQPLRPVLQGNDRAPVWPAGLIGSITHTDRDCLAVVTDAPEVLALGIDMERATPLEVSLWPEVCSHFEIDWLRSLGPSQRGHFAKLLFSAKEAIYKAQYMISRTQIGFDSVEICMNLQTQSFRALFRQTLDGFAEGSSLRGRYAILSGNFVTAVEILR